MPNQPNYDQAICLVARYYRIVSDADRKDMLYQLLAAADVAGIPMVEVLDGLLTAVDAETVSDW